MDPTRSICERCGWDQELGDFPVHWVNLEIEARGFIQSDAVTVRLCSPCAMGVTSGDQHRWRFRRLSHEWITKKYEYDWMRPKP